MVTGDAGREGVESRKSLPLEWADELCNSAGNISRHVKYRRVSRDTPGI